MLKTVSSKPCAHAQVELDPYVPLNITLEGAIDGEARLYWRAEGEGGSIVEVGVRPADGRVLSVTLVNLLPGSVSDSLSGLEQVETMEGAPCVDLAAWPSSTEDFLGRFLDERCPVQLCIGEDWAEIWFSAVRVLERCFVVGSTRFGVMDQALVCVQVCGLTPVQLLELRASIEEP